MSDGIPRRIVNSAKSEGLDVSVRIGKGGITQSLIFELSDQLSRKPLVKVKANKGTTADRQQRSSFFSEIAKLTTSTLVFQRANVAVIRTGK